jgi:ElaB/YqjD/DUF883 family membrane-anchored ribosome-binding protein
MTGYFVERATMTNLMETASQFGAKVSEAKEQAEDLGRTAAKKLDEVRNQTADALRTAASSVRTTGRQSSEIIDNCATNTADRLDATASYVEQHDLSGVASGCRQAVRRHPAGSLMVATAIGFLAGSAIRRMTHSCVKESAKQNRLA